MPYLTQRPYWDWRMAEAQANAQAAGSPRVSPWQALSGLFNSAAPVQQPVGTSLDQAVPGDFISRMLGYHVTPKQMQSMVAAPAISAGNMAERTGQAAHGKMFGPQDAGPVTMDMLNIAAGGSAVPTRGAVGAFGGELPAPLYRATQEAGAAAPDLWHPIGAGIKLAKPIGEMQSAVLPIPGAVPRQIVHPETMLGGRLVPFVGDRSIAGKKLTSVEGRPVDVPLQGGPDFMRTHAPEGSAWASEKGVVSGLARQTREAAAGEKPVYGVYAPMGQTAVDFNTMMLDSVLQQLPASRISRAAKTAFNEDMRRGVVESGKKKEFPDFPGLGSPKLDAYLRDNGAARKWFVKKMGKAEHQEAGFPDVAATRLAITEPDLLNTPSHATGFNIAKLDPAGKVIADPKTPHATYDTQLAGEYHGSLKAPVPREVMFPDWHAQRRAAGKDVASDRRAFEMNSNRTQTADQQWLDGVMKYYRAQGLYANKSKALPAVASAIPVGSGLGANKSPFFSALAGAVDSAKLFKAPGSQWLGTLKNMPGVKPEELKATGLGTYLEGKKSVTKDELKVHLDQNQVKLGEVMKGGSPVVPVGDNGRPLPKLAYDDTKFSQYQLPGGENYREMLLTLPRKEEQKGYDLTNLPAKTPVLERSNFTGGHYDEPNVLAHVRMNDRVDAAGKKTLFLEEVQSDWHQKGRKAGYQSASEEKLNALAAEHTTATPERQAQIVDEMNVHHDARRYGVPDAPFKKDWHELALKRAIKHAVDNGYDSVSWTPGKVQAERYDLSKHVENVSYTKQGQLLAHTKHGDRAIDVHVPEDKLAEYVGKDVAEKLLKSQPDRYGERVLRGTDIQVGGEGMNAFYDKMLPAAANKLGKKYGAKVGVTRIGGEKVIPNKYYLSPANGGGWHVRASGISGSRGVVAGFTSRDNALSWLEKNRKEGEGQEVWTLPITDAMRKEVGDKGFALFANKSKGLGAVGVAGNATYLPYVEKEGALRAREHVPNMSSIGASFNRHEVQPGLREVPFSSFTQAGDPIPLEKLDKRTRQLAEDIKASGEINPLIVAIDKEGPYILEGGHRFDALRALGIKSFPAKVVRDLDEIGK